jgi:hypothetical protein
MYSQDSSGFKSLIETIMAVHEDNGRSRRKTASLAWGYYIFDGRGEELVSTVLKTFQFKKD